MALLLDAVLEAPGRAVRLAGYRATGASAEARQKTDPTEYEWMQRLPGCGLLQGSFRPQQAVCKLRMLVWDKAKLVAPRTGRMPKSLKQMNVRVHGAVSDSAGATREGHSARPRGGRAKKLAPLRDPP